MISELKGGNAPIWMWTEPHEGPLTSVSAGHKIAHHLNLLP